MFEIIVSLSSNSDDREIDKYHDSFSGSGSSGSSSRSSSGETPQMSNTCLGFQGFHWRFSKRS